MTSLAEMKRKRRTMDSNYPKRIKIQRRSLFASAPKMESIEEDADKAETTVKNDSEELKNQEKNARRTLASIKIGTSEEKEVKEIDKEDELVATENKETPKDRVKNKLEKSGNVKKVVKEKKEPERASEKKQEEEED
ncbi:unnamed protein product [Caenorhabditis brenneri]